jgi:hypothetical protein
MQVDAAAAAERFDLLPRRRVDGVDVAAESRKDSLLPAIAPVRHAPAPLTAAFRIERPADGSCRAVERHQAPPGRDGVDDAGDDDGIDLQAGAGRPGWRVHRIELPGDLQLADVAAVDLCER